MRSYKEVMRCGVNGEPNSCCHAALLLASHLKQDNKRGCPFIPNAYSVIQVIQGVQNVTKPMACLESVFPGRLISMRLWPPRSPDLSPPDRLLWGHLKDTVYSNHPHTHTVRASGQHSAYCGQDINWHIAKRVR
jgi:hypothetical protein